MQKETKERIEIHTKFPTATNPDWHGRHIMNAFSAIKELIEILDSQQSVIEELKRKVNKLNDPDVIRAKHERNQQNAMNRAIQNQDFDLRDIEKQRDIANGILAGNKYL